MKHPFRCNILPFFPIGAGVIGLALRIWLFSAIDEKNLLPAGHPADPLLYILTALTLGVLFLATRKLTPVRFGKQFRRLSSAFAYILAGLGLICDSLMNLSGITVRLAGIAMIAGILGGIILLCMAVLQLLGKKTHYLLYAALTVVLMLDAVAQCQVWGAESQLQAYFFPLLASIFLILSAYQKTALTAGRGNAKLLAFFSQSALFFCCLSLNTAQLPLYLGMLFWAAVQLYPATNSRKEA